MPVKKRTYNTRRIKRNCSYYLEEIADLFDLHKTSVRNWVKSGLPLIDNVRPHLIHGSALIAFLKERQSKRKQRCELHEFFCFKCRAPRPLWEGLVDIKITSKMVLQLSGVCSTCSTQVFKAGSVVKIPEYAKTFDVQTVQGQHIIERSHPTLMCHFERTEKT
jgi:hypothetical protein